MLRKCHNDAVLFVDSGEEIAAARRFNAKDEDCDAN